MTDRDDSGSEMPSIEQFGDDPVGDKLPIRERMRQRYGLSQRQWEYLVAAAIVVPYPLAITIYLLYNVSEPVFLIVTVAYSIVAMYGSYKL